MDTSQRLKVLGAGIALGAVVAAGTGIAAAIPPSSKVTICHRTASVTNPYVRITVARSSVDGNLANDRGLGDHYLEHRGPVGPLTSGEWGDIIPPIDGVHAGLNWDAAGRAVYDLGCVPGPVTTSPTTSTTTTSTTTTSAPEYT